LNTPIEKGKEIKGPHSKRDCEWRPQTLLTPFILRFFAYRNVSILPCHVNGMYFKGKEWEDGN
jgi:hypothetical protein